MRAERVLGVVMAGGGSRRMGMDKSRLAVRGESLLAHAAAVLRPVCDEVVVTLQPDAPWHDESLRAIHDHRSDCGPLAGLEAAMLDARAAGRACFLLACDLPNVGTEVVRHLLNQAAQSPAADVVVPTVGGRRQPLCALYRSRALASVRERIAAGKLSMSGLLATLEVVDIEIGQELDFYRADLFLNLNQPADLAGVSGLAR